MSSTPAAPYIQVQQLIVDVGRQQLALVTKPGLASWSIVSPTIQLFVNNANVNPASRGLLFGCHLGVFAAYLVRAYPSLELFLTDRNHTALEMTRLTLEANHITSVRLHHSIELPEEEYGKYDVICIQLPKGRQLGQRWLAQAFYGLHAGGTLYLAGANEIGIHPAIKDAQELFGNLTVLAYKKGNRIAQYIKQVGDHPKPEWMRSPGIIPGSWVEFTTIISNRTVTIHSLPGVFSSEHVDEGTRMLLEVAKIKPGTSVLDVGCGYGVIGLAAAQRGASSVHLVDNDLLSIASCKETLSLNGINNAQVFTGDLLAPVSEYRYDLILSNPPFHTGQAVNYRMAQAMIGQSYHALNPGGELVVVANRFIRYDRLIEAVFGNVSTLAETGKFQVFSGLKSG